MTPNEMRIAIVLIAEKLDWQWFKFDNKTEIWFEILKPAPWIDGHGGRKTLMGENTRLTALLRQSQEENETLKAQCGSFANINDTCRARGFDAGPSGRSTEDRVIALAQAYDKSQEENRRLRELVSGCAKHLKFETPESIAIAAKNYADQMGKD